MNPPPGPEGPPPARATVLVASSDSATRDLLRRVLDVPRGRGRRRLRRRRGPRPGPAPRPRPRGPGRVPRGHGRPLGVRPHPRPHRHRPAPDPGAGPQLRAVDRGRAHLGRRRDAREAAQPRAPALPRAGSPRAPPGRAAAAPPPARGRGGALRGGPPRRALVRVRGRAREPRLPAARPATPPARSSARTCGCSRAPRPTWRR